MRILEFANKTSTVITERPFARAAIVIGIGLVLLLASFTPLIASARADDNKLPETVHVTGNFLSTVQGTPTTVSTSSSLTITDRFVLSTFTGGIVGKSVGQQTIARDNSSTPVVSYTTAYNVFWGTVDGFSGSYSSITHYVTTTIGTTTTINGTSMVVAGSGSGGLQGICGGYTFTGTLGSAVTYDGTFQLGDSCHKSQ